MAGECYECGVELDADAAEGACRTCPAGRAAPVMPDDFWDTPELRKALAERHFGRIIRAYRRSQGGAVTQAEIGRWLGLTQGQVSRIERDAEPVRDLGKLERWARALHIPPRCLWFSYSDSSPAIHRGAPAPAAAPFRSDLAPVDAEAAHGLGRLFRGLDDWTGIDGGRLALLDYLSAETDPLSRDGRGIGDTSAHLFRAAAELYQLAGWRAYDTGHFELGARHLRLALRLAQDAADEALIAQVLASMSYHAAAVGSPGTAIDLARAAGRSARRVGLRVLHGQAAAMEARVHAERRDRRACLTALREVEPAIAAASGPAYALDGSFLHGQFAFSLRQLGQPGEAERYARRCIELSDGFERGRQLGALLLAQSLAGQGRVEEACAVGSRAVRMTSTVHSTLIRTCFAGTAKLLGRFRDSAAVGELYALMAGAGLPLPKAVQGSGPRS